MFLLQFTAATDSPASQANAAGIRPSRTWSIICPTASWRWTTTGIIQHANQAFLDLVQLGSKGSAIGESLGRWLWQPGADLNALLANVQQHRTVRLFTTTIRGELGTDTEIEISAGRSERRRTEPDRRVAPQRRAPAVRPAAKAICCARRWARSASRSASRRCASWSRTPSSIVEQHYVKQALELADGNRTATAELLGLSRQSLYAKLNRYGLDDKGPDTEETPED